MEKLPVIPSPPGAAFREFRVRYLPFLMFGLVLVGTVFIWNRQVGPAAFVGEVEMVRTLVSSTADGRVTQLDVDLLAPVEAGQPVAVVVPSDLRLLQAQASLSQARLEFVRATLEPRLRRDNNEISFLRLRLEWLAERVTLASLNAQLNFFEAEFERIRALETNVLGVVSIFDLQVAERDVLNTRAQIREQTELVQDLSESISRLQQSQDQLDEEIPVAIQAAMDFEEQALQAMEAQLQPIVLQAPMRGFVSMIYRRPGENIQAGDPILTISARESTQIVAYLRQPIKRLPEPGQKVEVRPRPLTRGKATASILRVGSQMEPVLPELLPLRPNNQLVEYGLPILVQLPSQLDLIPGELVDIHWAGTGPGSGPTLR